MRTTWWVIVGITCAVGIASGDPSIESKRDADEALLAEKAKAVVENCGTSIPVTYDRKAEPDKACQGAMHCHGYYTCIKVVEGIEVACSDHKDYKEVVANKIKSISCRWSDGSAKRTEADNNAVELALKDGALSVQFDTETNGDGHERGYAFVKSLLSSIYTEGAKCKKLRDPVEKLGPEEAEDAAKKLEKPKGMSDADFKVCHKIQLDVLGVAAREYRYKHSSHAPSSGTTAKVMHCKTDCAAQCHSHSPGDACQKSIAKCQKACE